jgi:hypothetical protein
LRSLRHCAAVEGSDAVRLRDPRRRSKVERLEHMYGDGAGG